MICRIQCIIRICLAFQQTILYYLANKVELILKANRIELIFTHKKNKMLYMQIKYTADCILEECFNRYDKCLSKQFNILITLVIIRLRKPIDVFVVLFNKNNKSV